MPLIKTINPDKNIFIGIWAITENLESLYLLANEQLRSECEQIKHLQKRKEFLASRMALEQVCKNQALLYTQVHKTQHGKPFFHQSDWHFSISHTQKYAVCAIQKQAAIGVDTERVQSKFQIIAQKFLTTKELIICGSDIEKIALRWCIKEAAYKWNGEKGLNFKTEIIISEDLKMVFVKGIAIQVQFEKIDQEHFWVVVF